MIKAIRANKETFKAIDIEPGFNLVLAEQTKEEPEPTEADRGKSTNGSGKTLLLSICHFCLGSTSVAKDEILVPELAGWEFSLTLEVEDRLYEATRSVDDPSRVRVRGDLQGWEIDSESLVPLGPETSSVRIESWVKALGVKVFGLDGNDQSKGRPTFGALFRYPIRRDLGAFVDPFRSYVFQRKSEREVSNAVLLGIDWHPFRDARQLLSRQKEVRKARGVRSRMESGESEAPIDTGRLQGELDEVESRLAQLEQRSQQFRVHPEFREIEQRVSDIGATIRERSRENVGVREALGSYRRAVDEVGDAGVEEVRRIYSEVSIVFPEQVRRRLKEAEDFSRRLNENRREYLSQEIERLEEEVGDLDVEIGRLSEERAAAMGMIDGTGNAEQLLEIRRQEKELIERRGELRTRVSELQGFQRELDQLELELAENKIAAQEQFDRGQASVGRVAKLFEDFTKRLLEAAGRLEIEVGRDGTLRLEPRFERKKSQGIAELLVFCYDLALAVAGAERGFGPGLLFHDSTIFDGVDQRQKAAAIELAKEQSQTHGFRYLLCINEGDMPWAYLDRDELREYLRGRLTDKGDGGLLGIRYGEPESGGS